MPDTQHQLRSLAARLTRPLTPLLLLLVGLLGWWIDKACLESSLIAQVQGVMGARAGRARVTAVYDRYSRRAIVSPGPG